MTATFVEPIIVAPAGLPRAQWLDVRRRGIGGSDAAAIIGLDRYAGAFQVYLDKIGELPDLPENEAMEWGRRLEPVVADAFAERTGIDVLPTPGTLAHPDRPWQLVNPDRLTGDGGVLECKNTSVWADGDWADGAIPDRVALQVHHTLAVTGRSHAHVAVLIGGNHLETRVVERDEQLIDQLTDIEAAFWQRVLDRIPPPVDGLPATGDLLNRLWHADPGKVRVLNPADTDPWLLEYRAAHAAEKTAKARKTEAANHLKALLGDAEVGVIDGEPVVTWRELPRAGYTVAPSTVRTLSVKGL